MLEAVNVAIGHLLIPANLAYLFLGSIIGLIFGILPGLGGVVALALALPFSFGMESHAAMLFFSGVMGSVAFGGSVSAILLNTPGTSQNAATCFDGYPMARKGEGNRALGISATACGLGAIFGLIILILLMPLVRRVVLLFGPPEFFMLVLFGLVTVALAARGTFLKGLTAGGIGILLSLIGFSPVFGILRFNFGSEYYLWDGVELISLVIGLFAISEVMNYYITGGTIAAGGVTSGGRVLDGVKEVFRHKRCFFRSSAIGTLIGIIPGVGGTVSNFVAYVAAKESSKRPETFGTGNPEGIIAAEAANDAKDGGALLPTVGFGIPGSAEMAVLLGGFILHGLVPGPLLIKEHLDIVFTLILGLLCSNIIASTFGLLTANLLVRITVINVRYIAPIVIVISFVGAYGIRENFWDVVMAFLFGLFGYGMVRFGFPIVCLVIGYILGIMAETAFHQSLMISSGSYAIFFTRTTSLILFVLLVLTVLLPFFRAMRREKSEKG
jgi:putative tricarboxylic transport membrane protein